MRTTNSVGRRDHIRFGPSTPTGGRTAPAATVPSAEGDTHQARVVIAHDYLTQRGGAERVVLAMARAFPNAPIVTSLYEREATYPEFMAHQVRTSALQRFSLLRRHHRLGLPLYASVFSAMHVEADLVLCSTSGWAHGVSATGRRMLYVENTARWLYQVDDYLRDYPPALRSLARSLGRPLRRWDRNQGGSADLVLANSQNVRERLAQHWGVEAEVLYPPHGADVTAEREPIVDLEPGYLLAVSRLVSHKRVDVLTSAMERLGESRLVIVGSGPESKALRLAAPPNCLFLEHVSDTQLRWLYANAAALLSATHEDFGLAPLEAMAFGRPVVVLRAGGFLETVLEGETGLFFDAADAQSVVDAVHELAREHFDERAIAAHAQRFDEARFATALRSYADKVLA
jgi:glycosyltransferase involved in cell wall biosynthesis